MLELTNLKSKNTGFEQSEDLSLTNQQDIIGGATGVPGASFVGKVVFGTAGAYVGSALGRRYSSDPGAGVAGGAAGGLIGSTIGTALGASLSD